MKKGQQITKNKLKCFKKKKLRGSLVLPFEEISIQTELSTPPRFRILGG